MSRTLAALVCVAGALVPLPACLFTDGHANRAQQTCYDWLVASECGSFDFSTVMDCEQFSSKEASKVDTEPFFDCLTAHTTCDTGASVATVDQLPCIGELLCQTYKGDPCR